MSEPKKVYVNHTVRTAADLRTGPPVLPASQWPLSRSKLARSIYTNAIFDRKCVEPVKRKHGNGEQWMMHRFPIRGGITPRDAMLQDLCAPNPLLKLIDVGE